MGWLESSWTDTSLSGPTTPLTSTVSLAWGGIRLESPLVAPPGNMYLNCTSANVSPGFWIEIHSSKAPSVELLRVVPSDRNQDVFGAVAPTWLSPPDQAPWERKDIGRSAIIIWSDSTFVETSLFGPTALFTRTVSREVGAIVTCWSLVPPPGNM